MSGNMSLMYNDEDSHGNVTQDSDASYIELIKESLQFIYHFLGSQECPIIDSGPLWNDRGRKYLCEANNIIPPPYEYNEHIMGEYSSECSRGGG